ncbi:MAG: hypothetical protein NT069_07955 [Planctomycetota bacterium]|nr:hypothetical protein [Planctomycetota bacterium]
MGRQQGFLIATVVLLASILATSEAEAGKFKFGTDETIRTIQPTNSKEFNLCHKVSTYFFVAGCYVKDDGYVLRKPDDKKSYIPLNEIQIQQLQREGELPDPLPKYSLSFFDYLFGYSNWIILAGVIGYSIVQRVRTGSWG